MDLVVQSHLASQGGIQRGAVSVLAAGPEWSARAGRRVALEGAAYLTAAGDWDYEWFGWSVAAAPAAEGAAPTLVVGAPGFKLAPAGPAVGRIVLVPRPARAPCPRALPLARVVSWLLASCRPVPFQQDSLSSDSAEAPEGRLDWVRRKGCGASSRARRSAATLAAR